MTTPDVRRIDLDADYQPLRGRVRDEVRQRIIEGVYPPGTRLIENDLAEQLGVSRVPVREALRLLEAEGFVMTVPRRGVEVRSLEEQDVRELFDVREALESLACAQASQRATDAELDELRAILDRSEKAVAAGDLTEIGATNEAFHDTILELAKNRLLRQLMDPLLGRLHWLLRQIGDPEVLLEEHRELLDVIASRDPASAAEHAARHAVRNREKVIAMLFGDADRPERRPTDGTDD